MYECPNRMTCFRDPPQEHVFGPFKGTHKGPGRKTFIWAPFKGYTHEPFKGHFDLKKRNDCWRVWSKDRARGSRQKVEMPKVLVDQVPCAARFRPDTLAIKLQNCCTAVLQHCLILCTKTTYKHRPLKATNTSCLFCLNLLFSLLKHQPRLSINMRLHQTC